jgi:hypothetical protein
MFIVPRVLELVFVAESLRPFYDEVMEINPHFDNRGGSERGKTYSFDEERRAVLKAELDAYMAHAWGLSRDELSYILQPEDVVGDGYPTETFRGLREYEIKRYGEFKTRRLVLAAWDSFFPAT